MPSRRVVPESPIEKAKSYLEGNLSGGFVPAAQKTVRAAIIYGLKKNGTHPAGITVEFDDERGEAKIYRAAELMETVPYGELGEVLDKYWEELNGR